MTLSLRAPSLVPVPVPVPVPVRVLVLVLLLALVNLLACEPPTKPVVLIGRVLLPSGAIDGEVLVNADGIIVCAAASCADASGYDDATPLTLANSVISPALINAHDHTDFATVAPLDHGAVR